MQWSSEQNDALKKVDKWFYTESKKKQIYRVFGYAGTGKTTLAMHFASNIDGLVCFAAFTGKAALMMSKKGCEGARTIHSLIYTAEVDKNGNVTFKKNRQSDIADAKLVIIDECSMVDEDLARDLLSFGKPILVLGDPAQLPPVKGAGFFTECKPDVMLTEIHRQAAENPIIHLATMVRQGEKLELGSYGESRIVSKISTSDLMEAEQTLVGRNVTRESLNKKFRKINRIDDEYPVAGERLICLKNDSTLGIYNGGMFTVEQVLKSNSKKTNYLNMGLLRDDGDKMPVMVRVHKCMFGDVPKPDWRMLKGTQEFDFGYAITCHKSQGSQWENVLIYDESWCFRDDWSRWLYTAITRASDRITVVKS